MTPELQELFRRLDVLLELGADLVEFSDMLLARTEDPERSLDDDMAHVRKARAVMNVVDIVTDETNVLLAEIKFRT